MKEIIILIDNGCIIKNPLNVIKLATIKTINKLR